MPQRIVIKVDMSGKNSRPKIFEIAGKVSGVELINIIGQERNHVEVIGDGIDSIELTKLLRKKVGSSELVSVGRLEYGGDGYGYGNSNGTVVHAPVGAYYSHPVAYGSGPGHGYLTTTHDPYTYGPGSGDGYLITTHKLDRPGYVYEACQHNPNTCSIL